MQNKKVLITGASRGIGYATALEFAKEGAGVIALARSADNLHKLQSHCIDVTGNDKIRTKVFDLQSQNYAEYEALAQSLKNIDILVHNAGYFEPAPIENLSAENWLNHLQVNLTAGFFLCKAFWPQLIENKGNITFVGSLAGVPGLEKFPTASAYTAAKMGLTGLTEVLSAEGHPHGIRVNIVSPGSTDTEMLRSVYPNMKPDMVPYDVARQILFWSSPASAPVSGVNIPVKVK